MRNKDSMLKIHELLVSEDSADPLCVATKKLKKKEGATHIVEDFRT